MPGPRRLTGCLWAIVAVGPLPRANAQATIDPPPRVATARRPAAGKFVSLTTRKATGE
jgi:hypothetical protein